MEQNLTPPTHLGRFQNQGYEYLSSIYRMKEEHDQLSSRGITPFIMPIKVLSVACLAIEEYINVAGFRIVSDWEEFNHEDEPVRTRIERIFKVLGKSVSFETGIWKDVLELFEVESRVKEEALGLIAYHEKEIPQTIKEAIKKYPIRLSLAIAERTIELLLNHSSLSFPVEKVVHLV